jgi:HAD superfamily hydrolase (TIGR01509 family)
LIRAVIFDCDGVLVDSEVLIHAIELAALAELGMPYESAPFKARFLGMSNPDYYAALDADAMERLGQPIRHLMQPKMKERVRKVFDEELQAVPGAGAAVASLRLPRAVASSSGVEALDYKLKKLGLWDVFAPHVYSAEHVARAKPAPDLFLHAATQLQIAPADCLVIEDSVNGVKAGLAAGMTVWGFSGGGHMDEALSARLADAGAHRLVAHWAEAEKLFAAF